MSRNDFCKYKVDLEPDRVEASALDRGKIAFLPQTKDEFYKLANNKGG